MIEPLPFPGRSAAAKSSHEAVRRQNLSLVLRRLHLSGAASRSDLVEWTGLNRSTVGDLVAELANRGLVTESAPRRNGLPGRPSPTVQVRADRVVVLAIEVYADHVGAALVGLGGAILVRATQPRGRVRASFDDDLHTIADLAGTLLRHPLASSVGAIGVAVAGAVGHDGTVSIAPSLPWHDVPLVDRIREVLSLDLPVVVGNDANLATLAEFTRGSGVGCRQFVGLWGDFGVGSGIIVDGTLTTGGSGYAGELGHLPIRRNGRRCDCGARGCWETEVGEQAVLRAAGLEGHGSDAIDQALALANRGDPVVLAGLQEVGRWLGAGLLAVATLIDPERISIGGLLGRFYPYMSDSVTREFGRGRSMAAGHVQIVLARLGANAAVLGAAELAFAPLLSDPASVQFIGASPAGRWVRRAARKEVAARLTA